MTTKPKMSAEMRAMWEATHMHATMVINIMERDGDFGPEWASLARNVLSDMDDFVLSDDK